MFLSGAKKRLQGGCRLELRLPETHSTCHNTERKLEGRSIKELVQTSLKYHENQSFILKPETGKIIQAKFTHPAGTLGFCQVLRESSDERKACVSNSAVDSLSILRGVTHYFA